MEKFGFIIHPITHDDFSRKFPALKKVPNKILDSVFKRLPPFKVSHITGIKTPFSQAEGWFVGCPLSSEQIMRLPTSFVIDKIIQAGKKAEQLGAKVVGLGALTAVVGDAGVTVADNLNIPVTTGNSYTIATAIEGVKKASSMLGYDYRQKKISIIGATGSIGQVCAKILAKDVRFLELVGRDKRKLEQVASDILDETGLAASISTNVRQSAADSDIIITVTGAVDAVIEGDELKPGALVCDVARPRDVSWRVASKRDDVLVIEGGIVEVPGEVDFNFDFGFPSKTAYACMAETMILALEQRYESFSLGRKLTVNQVEEITSLAAKHGFKLAGFRSFEREVDIETIEKVKQKAKSKV